MIKSPQFHANILKRGFYVSFGPKGSIENKDHATAVALPDQICLVAYLCH